MLHCGKGLFKKKKTAYNKPSSNNAHINTCTFTYWYVLFSFSYYTKVNLHKGNTSFVPKKVHFKMCIMHYVNMAFAGRDVQNNKQLITV